MIQTTQQTMTLPPRPGRTAAPIERRIADLLQVNHRGRERALARRALVAATGISDREVRVVIASLVTTHGCPIGASPTGGYYWIDDPEELRKESVALTKKIGSLARRVRALVGGDEAARLLGQMDLGDQPRMNANEPFDRAQGRRESNETNHV